MTTSIYSDSVAATVATAPTISPAVRDRIITILNPTGGTGR